eukprot:c42528_g1_i1 orf=114-362(+)
MMQMRANESVHEYMITRNFRKSSHLGRKHCFSLLKGGYRENLKKLLDGNVSSTTTGVALPTSRILLSKPLYLFLANNTFFFF